MTALTAFRILTPLLLVVAGAVPQRAAPVPVERYTAYAINMADMSRAATAIVDIDVEGWTSDAVRDHLVAVLHERGQDEMVKALREHPRIGVIRLPGNTVIELRYAQRQVAADKTEQIVLIAERPVDLQYQLQRPGISGFPFSMAELRLDATGKGAGTLSTAAKIGAVPERGFRRLEDYDRRPINLTQVRRLSKPKLGGGAFPFFRE